MIQPDSVAQLAPPEPDTPRVSFDFAAFDSAEAIKITGAPRQYQAELRRRHILGHPDGTIKYDLFGLAFLHVVSRLPMWPTIGKPLAQIASFAIGWYILGTRDSYSGDVDKTLSWDRELGPRLEAFHASTALLKLRLAEGEGVATDGFVDEAERALMSLPPEDRHLMATQCDWLRARIMRARRFKHTPERFLIRWGTNKTAFCADAGRAFENSGIEARYAGCCVTLDLVHLATELMTAAGRPFVKVEFKG